jgi:small subunit ribosomal protein S18
MTQGNKKNKKVVVVKKPSKKKTCELCGSKIRYLDYKDVNLLQRYITERGKILHRRTTKTCAKHQRLISTAIKRARAVALLPYIVK